jgi:hypothetical protein
VGAEAKLARLSQEEPGTYRALSASADYVALCGSRRARGDRFIVWWALACLLVSAAADFEILARARIWDRRGETWQDLLEIALLACSVAVIVSIGLISRREDGRFERELDRIISALPPMPAFGGSPGRDPWSLLSVRGTTGRWKPYGLFAFTALCIGCFAAAVDGHPQSDHLIIWGVGCPVFLAAVAVAVPVSRLDDRHRSRRAARNAALLRRVIAESAAAADPISGTELDRAAHPLRSGAGAPARPARRRHHT